MARSAPWRSLRISVGKEDSVRPSDLVGAIAGEARVSSSVIGAIKVHDDYSLVEVPDESGAEKIVDALKATKIRGNKVDDPGRNQRAGSQPATFGRPASSYIH